MGSLGRAKGSAGSFGFAWVDYCTPGGCRVHMGSLGFTPVRLSSLVSLCSCGFSRMRLGYVARSLGFSWVHSGAPRGRRVHSGSRGFNRALVVVVHSGSCGFTPTLILVVGSNKLAWRFTRAR